MVVTWVTVVAPIVSDLKYGFVQFRDKNRAFNRLFIEQKEELLIEFGDLICLEFSYIGGGCIIEADRDW